MKLSLNKEFFYQLFFTFCVVIPFFNNYELSFISWLLALVLTFKKSYSASFLRYVSYFIFIFILAFIVGVFYQYRLYFVIRDITYLLKPILGLFIGYQFFNSQIKNPFKFLLYSGLAMAIIHLALVGYGIVFQGAKSVASIREYGGYFNDYEIYTFIILLFHKKFQVDLSTKRYRLFFIIMGLSTFFYLARTNFIQLVILFMAMKGWLILNKKSLTIIGTLIIASVLSYTAIYLYNPKRNGDSVNEFLYKIKLIPLEAFATKINRNDWKDFHDHYRSYENVRTIEQLTYNDSYILGEGIGSQVDLKQKVRLGDMDLRHISILHNGYMTVYLKAGIPGLLLLFGSIFYFFRKQSSVNDLDHNINLLFIGTGLFLIISYWVFMGFYNLLDSKSLLIGFLFSYKNHLRKITY
ncbi:O-antigen ligase family protein [Flavobacterium channae]|uniref:O-antigen ligase family protein n=1 Tax=Flavobacterium channae TaxID=2897181 RepID=UPI001E292B85|nr:O-antigen ligase family protein [Flavobacterium channae]UGS23640.1 O-antigen ligase family protein [Flavobacterium channae]